MRIAFLTPEFVTEDNFDGGLATYLGRITSTLVEIGHQVVVFVASPQDGMITYGGVEVYRVKVPRIMPLIVYGISLGRIRMASQWIVQSIALNNKCRAIHRNAPFDIIQYASYSAMALFRNNSVPAVVRLSSYEPLLQKAYERKFSLDGFIAIQLERLAISKADAVYSPSRLIANMVSQKNDKKIDIIEPPFIISAHGNDATVYRDYLADKKYLLFFGSLGTLKGVPAIAAIINDLLSAHPDIYFVFVGKDLGYEGKPMIDHVRKKAGIHERRVLYLGKLPPSQLYPILQNAYAVVLPSRIDNLPNTCLEAMSFNRVVIGNKGASFEQLIVDRENGFLADCNDPRAFLEIIEAILDKSPEEMAKIGMLAANRISSLKPTVMGERLIEYFTTVISQ